MAVLTAIPDLVNRLLPVANNGALANMLRTLKLTPAADASATTYVWTTAPVVGVSQAGATCNITLPNETDLVSFPVGEARTLFKNNTSVNVIGFVALTNVSFNLAAVNTAITTLIGSATVPGIATGLPIWTIYRASATSYLFFVGA